MICRVCANKGITAVPWLDAPDDYALCLCTIGLDMRREVHGYALWQVWASREGVDPSRIFLLEEILTPAELRAWGLTVPAQQAETGREAALLAAGKPKGKR